MSEKIIIDAADSVMGRIASFAAKQALQGNDIVILNSEKALISGRREEILWDFKDRKQLNTIKPEKGPFFSRNSEKIMKRCVRGMLPDYRLGRGKIAWKKIRCYVGIPEEFAKEKHIKVKGQHPKLSITIGELGKYV